MINPRSLYSKTSAPTCDNMDPSRIAPKQQGRFGLVKRLMALVLLGPGTVSVPAASEWNVTRDPHGFEVSLPTGWSTRVLGNGAVVFTTEPETLLGPQAFVWVMHLKNQRPAAEVARALVTSYREVVRDIVLEGPHQLGGGLTDSCSMRGAFRLLNERWGYVFVLSAKGNIATLTGFSGPESQLERLKPILVKILSSFKLNPNLRDPKRIAPLPGEWIDWRDPREGAFTMKLPKGWTAEGGIVRPYTDAWGAVTCKKGGKDTTALTLLSPAAPLFTEPNPLLASAGFGEGSVYDPSGGAGQGQIVMRYLGARNYVERWLLPQIAKTYPDVRLVYSKERPDFARALPRSSWIQTSGDGAEAEMTATVSGTKVRGRAYVLTTRIAFPGAGALWHATVGLVSAPPEEFDQALDIFWRVRDSFALNPTWAAEEARQIAIRSRIIAAAHDDISNSIRQTYETRSRTMDEISRKWSNAILGVVDLVNPTTGDIRYSVPNGSNYYWELGGKVLGTETHTSPGIGAFELQNLDDLIKRRLPQ